MDTLETTDWTKLLYSIVAAINGTENPAIGNLRPDAIKTPFDDEKLQDVFSQQPDKVHWFQQIRNQEEYESNQNNIQQGDLVLVNERKKDMNIFRKGYQQKVNLIIEIFFYYVYYV